METSFFRRSFAWLIDKIIVIPLFFVVSVIILGAYKAPGLFGYSMGSLYSTPYKAELYTPSNYLIIFLIIFLAVNRSYYFLCELLFKKTLGKFATRLEIRNLDNSPISALKSFVRIISYWGSYIIILSILCLIFYNSISWFIIILLTNLIILLVPLYITNGTQTLYDLISSSRVLKKEKKVSKSALIPDNLIPITNISTVNDFIEAETQLNDHLKQKENNTISSKIKKTTEESWALTFISILLSFCILNSLLRFYRYYNYYVPKNASYGGYGGYDNYYDSNDNVLENYFLRITFLALLSVMIFLIINKVYKKMIQKDMYYFPSNKGVNRLLAVVATTIGSYNEIIYSINHQFEIRENDWISFFQFNYNGSSYYSGIFLYIMLFFAYMIFIWIYRGFKEKELIN